MASTTSTALKTSKSHSVRPIQSLIALGTVLGIMASPTVAQAASFIGLGDLPGGDGSFSFGDVFSSARAISADGRFVTGLSSSAAGREAFIWDRGGGMRGLGDLPGDTVSSSGGAISADGSVIAGYGNGNAPNDSATPTEAIIWNAQDGIQGIGYLPQGGYNSHAHAISSDGTTVVGRSSSVSDGAEAFIWNATDGMRNLGDLPGGSSRRNLAFDVSGDGKTVVGSSESASGTEAFIWDEINGMQGLGDLPGGDFYSVAYGISEDGTVITGIGGSATGQEAFIWDQVGGMRGLGYLDPSHAFSLATGISRDGSVIAGRSGASSNMNSTEAFIWRQAGGMLSVESLLISAGIDLTGWQLLTAQDVSADGLKIVGTGLNPQGNYEAYLADVTPVPTPALLPGLIGFGISLVRKRKFRSLAQQS